MRKNSRRLFGAPTVQRRMPGNGGRAYVATPPRPNSTASCCLITQRLDKTTRVTPFIQFQWRFSGDHKNEQNVISWGWSTGSACVTTCSQTISPLSSIGLETPIVDITHPSVLLIVSWTSTSQVGTGFQFQNSYGIWPSTKPTALLLIIS